MFSCHDAQTPAAVALRLAELLLLSEDKIIGDKATRKEIADAYREAATLVNDVLRP